MNTATLQNVLSIDEEPRYWQKESSDTITSTGMSNRISEIIGDDAEV